MATQLPILVVGGDGLVGRALVAYLRRRGRTIVATSRRAGVGDLRLDLADPASWPDLPPASAAVFVAAVARLGDCERDPALAERINSIAPAKLAARLAGCGTFCLQLSTDKVFDGTIPLRARGDTPCPLTAYGRQKAAAEQAVLQAGGAVLRLSKVLAPDLDLLQDWRRKLLAGEAVTPFHDLWLAPVTVGFVVDLIRRLLDERIAGIHHCSGREDRPYVALANALARALGASANLVRPISAGPLFPPAQRVPHSSLEMGEESRRYGLTNPDFDATVDAVIRA